MRNRTPRTTLTLCALLAAGLFLACSGGDNNAGGTVFDGTSTGPVTPSDGQPTSGAPAAPGAPPTGGTGTDDTGGGSPSDAMGTDDMGGGTPGDPMGTDDMGGVMPTDPGVVDGGIADAAIDGMDGMDGMDEVPAAGNDGTISIADAVPGFASEAGGTTGGGTDLASAISVNSMAALRNAASGSARAIILVEPGDYAGELAPGANKTIIGVGPGVKLTGNLKISGSDRHNIIVRNIAVQGERCGSYDACKSGADAVYVGNGAHHVWLDHLDISDGQDGNCDITQGGDYVTVSWTHFHYTYNKEHRFSNLIAGSDDEPASVGKLHITYMNSHWGERVDQRQPRGRFGNVHMLNNYHNTGGSQIHGVGKDMALIAENSVYDEGISIWKDMGSPRGWKGVGNIGSGRDLNDARGAVFAIPYSYTAMPASEVVAAVTSATCGAGNTCELAR